VHIGDVVYINVLGQEMIILNSSKAAVDLLDKRSANYSDRPVVMMCGEIVGWNRSLALPPVRSTIPGIQEVLEQVYRDAGEHGKVYAITGEGDGQIPGEGYGRSWFAGSPNSQVSGLPNRHGGNFLRPYFSWRPVYATLIIGRW
jgi:hypothetical protein